MRDREIYITEYDMKRLRELLEVVKESGYRGRDDLKRLEAELNRGKMVPPRDVPADVITMNSKVCLIDLDTGEEMTCTLVFPDDADIDQNRISVLAPIGTAMLGYSVGDAFEWQVPAGLTRFKVKEILYQPEASGDYHL
jgi:regulator of nucleoside diphosphate kinase